MSAQELLDSLQSPHKELELRPQLEAILRRIPAKWNEYRKRQKQDDQVWIRMKRSPSRPGRPNKAALAEEAAKLQRDGKNNPQIATELNRRHGQGTTTSGAVRKLLKRHPDKS
jgi:hypothetical protein